MIGFLKNAPLIGPFLGSGPESETKRENGVDASGSEQPPERVEPGVQPVLRALSSTHDFVLLVGEDGRVQWVNPRLRERLGPDSKLEERPLEDLFDEVEPLPADQRGMVRPGPRTLNRHLRTLIFDGQSHPVRLTVARDVYGEQSRSVLCLDRIESRRETRSSPVNSPGRSPAKNEGRASDPTLERTPLPMMEVDLSRVKQYLDQLQDTTSEDGDVDPMDRDEVARRCVRETRIVDVNQAAVDLLNAPDRETVKQDFTAVLFDSHNPDSRRGFRRVAKGIPYFETLTTLPTFSDQVRHVRLTARVPQGHREAWDRVYVTMQDVTDQVHKEHELRVDKAHYRSLFQDSPIPLWVEDFSRVKPYLEELKDRAEGGLKRFLEVHPEEVRECIRRIELLDVNQAAVDYNEFPNKEHLREHFNEWLSSLDPKFFHSELLFIARGERRFQFEKTHWTRKGNRREVEMHWSVPPDAAHDYSRVYISEIDLTSRKKVQRKLEESELRFRQIAENIQDVFWLTSPDHRQIHYVSPKAKNVYGMAQDEFLRQPQRLFERVHPEDRSRVRRIKTDPDRVRFELEYRLAGEENPWIQERGFPVRNANGEVIRIASVAEDVTHRRQVERQLRQSEKLAAIGQTAATVMHKINNPNAFVKGNLEYIQQELYRLNERVPKADQNGLSELREAVREAHEGTERIERFVNDMKWYARRGDEVKVTPYDPVEVLQKTLNRLRGRWKGQVELLERRFGLDGGVKLRGAPREFAQVIEALVENAVEACPEGKPCTVVLELHRRESALLFLVQDRGSGIENSRRQKIFEPFYTTKPAEKGIGLGLTIVRDIVERMDGNIDLCSTPGEGTSFLLRFPLEEVDRDGGP